MRPPASQRKCLGDVALRAQTIGVRMKSKTILKSPDRLSHCHAASNNRIKTHAMIRRRAWRCVRPVVKEPDVIALRKLEQIDFRELLEILEEEKKSSAAWRMVYSMHPSITRLMSGGC